MFHLILSGSELENNYLSHFRSVLESELINIENTKIFRSMPAFHLLLLMFIKINKLHNIYLGKMSLQGYLYLMWREMYFYFFCSVLLTY